MDKKKLLMAGAAMVTLSPLAAKNALAATANITMHARVLQAIQLAQIANLDFGTFSVGATGGSIVILPVGADTLNPGTVNQIGTSTPNEAKFQIKAATGFPIVLSVPAADTVSNGAQTMAVNNFNLVTDAAGAATTITLAANTETHPIGASLVVGAAQAAGTYTGSFTLTANYQ